MGILHKDQWPQVWEAIRAEVGQPEWPTSIPWPGLSSGGPKTVRELVWQSAASLPKPDVAAGQAWNRSQIQAEIRKAGFRPAVRNSRYEILQLFE